MKKKVIWIIVLILFVISLIVLNYYLNNREKKEPTKIEDTNASSVLIANSSNFNEEVLNSEKTVLIDFYADWCPPCRLLSPLVEEVASEKENIKFVKINTDENAELASRYSIAYLPTLIVIKDGKEVNRSIGYVEKEEIYKLIE